MGEYDQIKDVKAKILSKMVGFSGNWSLLTKQGVVLTSSTSTNHDEGWLGCFGNSAQNLWKDWNIEGLGLQLIVRSRRRLGNQRLIDRFIRESIRCQSA